MADNTVTLVGNLVRDFELRFTAGGRAVASSGLAVSRRYQVNNEWQESTSFFNITAWGQLGENASASLTKGARVIVTGRLEQRSYESNGEKKSIVEVVADEIGPSLKWATCQVERTTRTDSDPGAYKGGSTSSSRQAAPVYGDEEPFVDLGNRQPDFRNMATAESWL